MVISFYPRNFRGFFFGCYDAAHKSLLESSIFERDNFPIDHYLLHYLLISFLTRKSLFYIINKVKVTL